MMIRFQKSTHEMLRVPLVLAASAVIAAGLTNLRHGLEQGVLAADGVDKTYTVIVRSKTGKYFLERSLEISDGGAFELKSTEGSTTKLQGTFPQLVEPDAFFVIDTSLRSKLTKGTIYNLAYTDTSSQPQTLQVAITPKSGEYDALAAALCKAGVLKTCNDSDSIGRFVRRIYTQELFNHRDDKKCGGIGFDSGSFVVHDHNTRLCKALKANPDVYRRGSSHAIPGCDGGTVAKCKNWGLELAHPFTLIADAPDGPVALAKAEEGALNSVESTLLWDCFVIDGTVLVYIKPESHGTAGIGDLIEHMKNYKKAKKANKGKKKYSRQEGGSMDRFNQLAQLKEYAEIKDLDVEKAEYYVYKLIKQNANFAADIKAKVAEDLGVDVNADHADKLESGYKYRLGKEIFVPEDAATAHLDAVRMGQDESTVQGNCA